MRVLVTGGAGLLGTALIRLRPAGAELLATRRSTPVDGHPSEPVDLADADAVDRLVRRFAPSLVIHTAYGTERPERDILHATRNVARACRSAGARLIHLSSDALLDGERAPYDETAAPDPVHDYGRWKAEAEAAALRAVPAAVVVRTSLLTCFEPLDPRSRWVADALRERRTITLFVDELRCPIHPDDLAGQLWEVAGLDEEAARGVWNLVGPEALSRYALGLLIAAHRRLDPAPLLPGRSRDAPGRRPRDLRLSTARADRQLHTRPRPVSALALPPPAC
jgi:dTDP-4-dehydrorhamnose reductase